MLLCIAWKMYPCMYCQGQRTPLCITVHHLFSWQRWAIQRFAGLLSFQKHVIYFFLRFTCAHILHCFFFFLRAWMCVRPLISQLPGPLVALDSRILVFLCCCVLMSPQHCSKSASTSWMWLLRSSVIIANKPWPRITLTMTTTALILIMAVFNMVSFYVQILL